MELESSKQESQGQLLRPYKSIGVFLDSNRPLYYSAGKKDFLAASTGNSFKIYKLPELKIKLLGPHFPNSISSISAVNEYLYVASKNEIIQMKYYHIVNRFQGHKEKVLQILNMGSVLVSSDRGNNIFIWHTETASLLHSFQVEFDLTHMIHPITYLNKLLVLGRRNAEIWNINTQKLIYSFDATLSTILNDSSDIISVECSPIIDIVALGLSNGLIWFLNIKTDKLLFSLRQGTSAETLAFSKADKAVMASGDSNGTVFVWDLNEKRLLSTIKNAHRGPVTFIQFLNDELIMLTGSAEENAIFEWKYEEMQEEKFFKVRSRKGLEGSIKKLR
jgi:U3 small nucleolar RNA-associated protein 21